MLSYSCFCFFNVDHTIRKILFSKKTGTTGMRQYSFISCCSFSEVLSKPVLEIDTNNDLIPENMMKLICHNQYNAPAPAPPIHYYFYKNNQRVGTSTSEDNDLVHQTSGEYTCKVKVPELGLSRLSDPKNFTEGT